jgi:hypothetical protein
VHPSLATVETARVLLVAQVRDRRVQQRRELSGVRNGVALSRAATTDRVSAENDRRNTSSFPGVAMP